MLIKKKKFLTRGLGHLGPEYFIWLFSIDWKNLRPSFRDGLAPFVPSLNSFSQHYFDFVTLSCF